MRPTRSAARASAQSAPPRRRPPHGHLRAGAERRRPGRPRARREREDAESGRSGGDVGQVAGPASILGVALDPAGLVDAVRGRVQHPSPEHDRRLAAGRNRRFRSTRSATRSPSSSSTSLPCRVDPDPIPVSAQRSRDRTVVVSVADPSSPTADWRPPRRDRELSPRASSAPRSERSETVQPNCSRLHLRPRRPVRVVHCGGPVPVRPRSGPSVDADRAPSGRDRVPGAVRGGRPPPRRCVRSGGPNGPRRRAAASRGQRLGPTGRVGGRTSLPRRHDRVRDVPLPRVPSARSDSS